MNFIHSTISYLNKKGFFDLLVAKFLIQFIGFGTILFVTKFLAPEEIGQIKIIQSYAHVFAIVAGFGFNTAVLKICSERSSAEAKQKTLNISFKLSLGTSLTTYFLLCLLISNGYIASSPKLARWLIVYCTIIPVLVATDILVVFLQSQKKIKLMARIQAFIKIQSAIFIVTSSWIWGFEGFIFSTIFAYVLGLAPLLWEVGFVFLRHPVSLPSSRLLKYAVLSMSANLVSQIGQRGDFFILDHLMKDRAAIGYYSLATIFLLAATQVTGAVQQIITPYFSENANNAVWIQSNLKQTIRRMLLLSIATAISVYVAAFCVIYLFLGASYNPTLDYLPALLLQYIIFSSYAIIGGALVGLGFMGFNFLVGLLSTPLSLLIAYWGLQHYGLNGVAWSKVISTFFTACLSYAALFYLLNKHYKKDDSR